jgi:hypothetical protein
MSDRDFIEDELRQHLLVALDWPQRDQSPSAENRRAKLLGDQWRDARVIVPALEYLRPLYEEAEEDRFGLPRGWKIKRIRDLDHKELVCAYEFADDEAHARLGIVVGFNDGPTVAMVVMTLALGGLIALAVSWLH